MRHNGNIGEMPLSTTQNGAATVQFDRPRWPAELEREAFCGLAGEIIKALEPYTEADPAALLTNLLVAFGNVIGRRPYWSFDGSPQFLRLNAVLVGETSKGRKGTSWGPVRSLLEKVEPSWAADKITSGLSSGEGLIWAVRDEVVERRPIKDREGRISTYQDVVADHGVADKRLLVFEDEFGRLLKVMAREGNIVSSVIRQAWDSGNISSMTKNAPVKATSTHISIIGHITRDELVRYMTETDAANGFANRFLWVMTKRSRILPEGGQLPQTEARILAERLGAAVEHAKSVQEIKRDEAATQTWCRIYEELSEGKPGLIGSVLSRSEAQVMRIACLYALLDQSTQIREEHLFAALAFWRRAEASVHYIFGSATGDQHADAILRAMRVKGRVTRTEINNLFHRNIPKERIDAALAVLEHLGLAERSEEETEGRPVSFWHGCDLADGYAA
jgi:hypothetical protein